MKKVNILKENLFYAVTAGTCFSEMIYNGIDIDASKDFHIVNDNYSVTIKMYGCIVKVCERVSDYPSLLGKLLGKQPKCTYYVHRIKSALLTSNSAVPDTYECANIGEMLPLVSKLLQEIYDENN